jgi:hypothetical protein
MLIIALSASLVELNWTVSAICKISNYLYIDLTENRNEIEIEIEILT